MTGPVQPQRTPGVEERAGRPFLLAELDDAELAELACVPRVAVHLLPHCQAAELLVGRGHQAQVVAVSDGAARAAADTREQLFHDPARLLLTGALVRGGTLPARWRQYQRELQQAHGWRSFVALPIRTGVDHQAALLLHSCRPDPLATAAPALVQLLSSLAGDQVRSLVLREQVRNLRVALASNRQIGVALGIVMERLQVTEPEAFLALQKASQSQNRKLREVADEVVVTGQLAG